MDVLTPAILANPSRRARCPECAGTVTRTPIQGTRDSRRLRCECAYCDWQRDVEFPEGRPDEAVIVAAPDYDAAFTEENARRHDAMAKRRADKTGLDKKEYMRWYNCGKPDLAAWKAAGKPNNRDWKKIQEGGAVPITPEPDDSKPSQAATAETNLKKTTPDCAAPAAKTPDDMLPEGVPLPGFQLLQLPAGVDRICVGMMGNNVTVAETSGRVIEQFPIEA